MVNPQNTFCCLNPNCPQPLNTVEQASSLLENLTCLACNTPLTILDQRDRPKNKTLYIVSLRKSCRF